MPQQVAAPAGEEIEVAVPLAVPDVRPFAADQRRRESGCSWGSTYCSEQLRPILLASSCVALISVPARSPCPRPCWYRPPAAASAAAAVDDVDLADACCKRLQAGLDLGDHARVDRPACRSAPGPRGGERVDQRLGVVLVAAHAVDVAEEHELLGLKAWATAVAAVSALTLSFWPSSVRHIEGITGTMPCVAELLDGVADRRGSRADVAQVDRLAAVAVEAGSARRTARCWCGSSAAWPGRRASSICGGEVLVDLAGQDPLDDLQGGVVGVAAALDEPGLPARPRPWPG